MKHIIVLGMLMFTGCTTTCKGVIGASYVTRSRTVDYCYTNTPCEALGIKPGDELIYPESWEGAPGEEKEIRWVSYNGPAGSKSELYVRKARLMCVDELYEWNR